MPRRDDKNTGSWRQLGLFEQNDTHKNVTPQKNNVICFKDKIIDSAYQQEKEKRNRCIDKLLSHAEKLNW